MPVIFGLHNGPMENLVDDRTISDFLAAVLGRRLQRIGKVLVERPARAE